MNQEHKPIADIQQRLDAYAKVDLKADLSSLTDNQKKMIPILLEVAEIMEELFWKDAIGDKSEFLSKIKDPAAKAYAQINYGPWDRLDGNKPFLSGFGPKPLGANFYPADITKDEVTQFKDDNTDNKTWYTKLKRENGKLKQVFYHDVYPEEIKKAADLLEKAAELAEDAGFKKFLQLRAEAFRTDSYLASDLAWMDMKTNSLDFVVGPIESYEDALKGLRASHSGQLLMKNKGWSKKLERFNQFLPALQESLPVAAKYKSEKPSTGGDMNVYEVLCYAGDCNAGSKNIAINLPNDPRVHAQKGSRKLQLRNVMEAKFNKIVVPISKVLIEESQLKHVKFEEAFFENVMFHEVAHGLGINYLVNDKNKTVKQALTNTYSTIEEAKADILGLYLITKLYEMGEFEGKDLMDNYVTFLAGFFRSIRFGVASSHGKANMLEFYYLQEKGAFSKDANGKYKVNFEKMKAALSSLGKRVLTIQGDGNKAEAEKWIKSKTVVSPDLKAALDKVNTSGIPKDIVFNQGLQYLGL
jgi:hypothetical protein